jgi:hypothetical protein
VIAATPDLPMYPNQIVQPTIASTKTDKPRRSASSIQSDPSDDRAEEWKHYTEQHEPEHEVTERPTLVRHPTTKRGNQKLLTLVASVQSFDEPSVEPIPVKVIPTSLPVAELSEHSRSPP